MRNIIKEFFDKRVKLCQSKDENYKEMKSAGICLFVLSILCFMFAYFSNNEWKSLNTIVKCIATYIGFLSMLTAICFLISYWYIYNDNTRIKKFAKFFIILITFIVIIILIMIIPLILPIKFIEKSLDYRAKKIDNLIAFSVFFVISIFFVMIFSSLNYSTAYYFSVVLENILTLKCNFNLDTSTTSLFIFISLIKLEIDIVSRCLIHLKKKKLKKSMLLKLKRIEKNLSMSDLNTENYKQEKSNKLKMSEEELKKVIDYDINYLKNTFKKTELAILIFMFMLVIFKTVPYDILESLEKYQSDIINVLTLYTLAMLYIDKRKEWK